MATIHANTQLKTGDTVNGLIGLKDCESGRGINLRLDGKAVVPEEWAAPCSPPTISGGNHKIVSLYYAEYDGYAGTPYLSKTFFEKYIFPNDETRVRVLQSIIPNKFSNIMNDWPHPGVRQNFDGTKSFRSELPNGQGYYIYSVVQSTTYLPKPSVAAWPPYIDSELIYDAASGRFKPACAQHDPHLPESLKNERRCLSLCDAEGNCVIIRRTERGIELWQEKYKQRTLIDPATGKVQAIVGEEKGAVKLKLTSLTTATLPANRERTTIGVGEGVTVSANQPVEWSIKGSLLEKEEKTATELDFIASDQAGIIRVTAKTECEEQSIEFSVIQPTGIKFVKIKDVHVHNLLSAGFVAQLYLQPPNVNFYRVSIQELDSPAYGGTGLFVGENGSLHGGPEYQANGGRSELLIAQGYSNEHGTLMGGNDMPMSARYKYCPNNISSSELHHDIPYEWCVSGVGIMHQLVTIHQFTIIDERGITTTNKAGVSATFHYSDPSLNIEEITKRNFGVKDFMNDC